MRRCVFAPVENSMFLRFSVVRRGGGVEVVSWAGISCEEVSRPSHKGGLTENVLCWNWPQS